MQLFQSKLDQFYEQMSARVGPESVLGQGNIPATGIGQRQHSDARETLASSSRHPPTHNPMPRVEFPRFDGVTVHSWLLSCETYFRVVPDIPEI